MPAKGFQSLPHTRTRLSNWLNLRSSRARDTKLLQFFCHISCRNAFLLSLHGQFAGSRNMPKSYKATNWSLSLEMCTLIWKHVYRCSLKMILKNEGFEHWNSKICVKQCFAVKNLCIWGFQKWNNSMQEICSRLPGLTIHILVFLQVNTNLWLSGHGESKWVGIHGFKSSSILKLLQLLGQFACQWTDKSTFILLPSLSFFPLLKFLKWQSWADSWQSFNS